MIFKRYGTSFHSVEPNFDSKALNEIGFRRTQEVAIPVADFEAGYESEEIRELLAEAAGPVQDETEQLLLDRLQEKLEALIAGLGSGRVLVMENRDGHDYPKTRQEMKNVVIEGENRFHFTYTLAPALRMGIYRKRN